MSTAKPTLSAPWSSGDPTNMLDPGAVNDTGVPAASKSIPRRCFNWAINKVDAATRYLVARGVPDWDPDDTYTAGDRVQFNATGATFPQTWVCASTTSAGQSPLTHPAKWYSWALTLDDTVSTIHNRLVAEFETFLGSYFPTYFDARLALRTAAPAVGEITPQFGAVSEAAMLSIPSGAGGPGLKIVRCKITNASSPSGELTVTLSGSAAISGAIWGSVTLSTACANSVIPLVVWTGTNEVNIVFGGTGYIAGPNPVLYVLLMGAPA